MNGNDKILDNLRRQCSRREYCSSDILKKARKSSDIGPAAAEKILEILKEEGYVDDLRYAGAYAREKSAISGWGAVKIRYMLSVKGISSEIIARALEQVDDAKADSRLEKLLENKYRTLKDDPQRKIKLLRFALGRGYSYEQVDEVLKRL